MSSSTIKPRHGWVLAAVVGSWIFHHGYLFARVMVSRKKYGISYPSLYATPENCSNAERRNRFNCLQRAHQNALENQSSFLALLLCAGLRYPAAAAAAAASYLLGRVIYSEGYATGRPGRRYWGFPAMYGGLAVLLGCTTYSTVQLLRGNA